MSSNDENLYRGDPSSSGAPGGQPAHGPQHGGPPPPVPQYGAPQYGAPGYGAPQYGAPGYGAPQYGAPGYGPPPMYGRPTNTMAVLALIMAFVFAPAGLILGIVARKQIRRTGEDGDGLALAGIIAGGIFTAIFVLIIGFWIIAFASLANSGSFGP